MREEEFDYMDDTYGRGFWIRRIAGLGRDSLPIATSKVMKRS